MSLPSLLRSEINIFNQDISRVRHVLSETSELFDEIEHTAQLGGGGLKLVQRIFFFIDCENVPIQGQRIVTL